MYASVTPMAIKLALRRVLARRNLERADDGLPPLTQIAIAEGSGVAQSVISSLLNGKSKRIDLATINGLCNYLAIRPGDLFDYTPDPTPSND